MFDKVGPIFSPWNSLPDSVGLGYTANWGSVGDYIAGVYGTIATTTLSIFTLAFVVIEYFRNARKDKLERCSDHFYHLLDQFSEISRPLREQKDKEKDVFSKFLSEFRMAYQCTKGTIPEGLRINAAYILTFFGPTLTATNILNQQNLNAESVDKFSKEISAIRNEKSGLFGGYISVLGNYQRSLFFAYKYLQTSPFSSEEKFSYAKMIRTQMTTNEQALLAINALSTLGRKWIDDNLISDFQVIKNVPKSYFNWGNDVIDIEKMFPKIGFEYVDYIETSDYSTSFF